MIRKLAGEIWKPMLFSGWRELRNRYAVSNKGRVASYKTDVLEDGKLLRGSITTGYRTLNLHRPGTNGTLYVHREVAKSFVKNKSSRHKYVVHINHDKLDNASNNLRWVTVDEMIKHQQASPAKIAYKEKQANRAAGLKLSMSQVKAIKKQLENKNRKGTIKQLAEKYNVSEMTIYRIKSGENWRRV